MAQVTFSIPNEVRQALRKFRNVNWSGVVSHVLWEYTKRLQLAEQLAQHSRLTPADVAGLDARVKAALAKRYRTR